MKLVIALGGNALLRRGQALSAANQLDNIRTACAQIARVLAGNSLLLTHGNGPQVGLLALQAAAYPAVPAYPMDVLGAESQGMIGYLLEQELANLVVPWQSAEQATALGVTTLLTRVEVDPKDAAFAAPTKPIGPVYSHQEALKLAEKHHWTIAADGSGFRRVVASPRPLQVLNLPSIQVLLAQGAVVIAAGGGGIPVMRQAGGQAFEGCEAVIDKDLCAALLANSIGADCLILATDVDAVYLDWGKPGQRALGRVSANTLSDHASATHAFAAGTMGPKVEAAVQFVQATGKRAAIGSLANIEGLVAGTSGTQITI